MTRLHADPVEVQRHDTGLGPEPARFLWRGRLYVVRDVLSTWLETAAWWQSPSSRAPDVLDLGERELWRVEASAGRTSGCGVFELGFSQSSGHWTLVRALD